MPLATNSYGPHNINQTLGVDVVEKQVIVEDMYFGKRRPD